MFRDSEAGVAPKLVRKFFSEGIELDGGVRRGVMRPFFSSELFRITEGRVIKMRCFQKKNVHSCWDFTETELHREVVKCTLWRI